MLPNYTESFPLVPCEDAMDRGRHKATVAVLTENGPPQQGTTPWRGGPRRVVSGIPYG